MAIDTLARGMAANASGGGGGGVDVGITPGVGIRFDGTDPVEIINTGVTAVTTPGSSGADADAPLGSVKVSNPGAENSADRVHYVVPKGLNNAAFKDVDTEINSSVATSTKLPTTKAVYDELTKKVEATLDTSTGDLTTTDDAHVATSKLIKAKLDEKLDTTTTINGVSVSSGSYTLDGDDIDLTDYTPISSGAEEDVADTDSVNDAIAKVEYKADNRIPTDNIDTDFPVSPDATHVLASTIASATFQGTGTAGVNPKKGLVPAPSTISGDETRYLKADGTWATPPNTEYSEGTGIDISNAGVISNTGVTHIENSDPADDNVGNGTFKVTENGTDKWIAIKGLDDAAYKDVDADTISDTTSTAKLPTDKAVAAYVSANYIPLTQKGTNSGVAELDASGKVLASQLPSFVDDVIDGFLYSDTFYTETPQQPINEVVPGYYYNDAFYEDSAHTELITGVEGKLYLDITSSIIAGYRYNETDTEYVSTTITAISTPETGKIYTDISTNKSYRWGGSAWSLVASDLALGETATTAYRGDRGKIAYDHSQTAHAPSNAEANVLEAVKINGVAQTISNKAIDITADTTPTDGSDNLITSDAVYDALTDKVDKEAGKGLSTNDLTDNLKNSYDGAVTHAGTTSGNPHNVSKSDVGLGNVTNNAQVKAVSGTVTNGGIVTFGTDGATVADSAKTVETTLTSNSDSKIPTSKAVATHVTSAISGKQDTLSSAQLSAVNSGIDSTKVAQISTNQSNILSVQNDVAELQKKAVKVYTYHVNPNESDPEDAVTYLDDATGLTPAKMGASSFSYGSWANAWFLPRPCVLKFDGTVDYYLNPNDYSKKVDGTASTIDSSNSTGNVMLEFPKIWVKRTDEGNGARTVSIAPVNVDDTYKCWSNINADNQEVDHFYLPAYNGTIHSNKMRSLSGVTLNSTYAPNYTRAQEVTAATANNPTGKNMWYTETWADMCLVYDLLYLMGKSLDVQRTFGQGLSSGSETAMRAYVTGTHDTKGLFYGDISGTSTAVKVLGMENLWGCRWHAVAGLINDNGTLKVKMTYGVADGSTAVGYNTTGDGYLNYGSTYGTNGYIKTMQADNTMGYKIIETAGTDATYYCDYYYVNNSQSNYALLGGNSGNGSYCGFYVSLDRGAGHASWLIGGSLSCRP